MDENTKFTQLSTRLYDAATDATLWPEVLHDICSYFDSACIYIFAFDEKTGNVPFSLSHEFNEENQKEYEEHIIQVDPRGQFMLENPEVTIAYDYLHTSEREIDRSEYYNWLSKSEFRYYLGTRTNSQDDISTFATLQRTRNQGHVEKDTIQSFSQLVPHLGKALQVTRKFANLDLRAATTANAIEQMSLGVLFVNTKFQITYVNTAANNILATKDGLILKAKGLQAIRRADNDRLQQLLGNAVGRNSSRVGSSLSLERPLGRRPYTLLIVPLPHDYLLFETERPAAAIFITDADQHRKMPEKALQQMFGLTSAEARLAALFATGKRLSEVAGQLGVTEGTARSQLKSIFRKTGTHHQAELIQLLLSSPAIIGTC